MQELMTVKEVAEYLRLCRTTVWRWVVEIPAYRVGRGWRIKRLEVEKIVCCAKSTMRANYHAT